LKANLLKLMKESYSVIKDEARWCTKCMAQDKEGLPVPVFDKKAYRWCSYGILCKKNKELRIKGITTPETLWEAEKYLRDSVVSLDERDVPGMAYTEFNDSNIHSRVMQMWKLAISRVTEDQYEY